MNTLVSLIMQDGYSDRILNERQLARILGGSDDRRYSLVKRALKSGDLIHIKRGNYALNNNYRNHPVHPFALTQTFSTGSYVSMETALAFHGWIPEAVYSTMSVTPGRKSKEIQHEHFGRFEFTPLALHKSGFLVGVDRHVLQGQSALVASPLRALMDIAAYRKKNWAGMSWITSGMRIDPVRLLETPPDAFKNLNGVYKHKAANTFLARLETQVNDMRLTQGTSRRETHA